jgi:multiple antibiotic resistance protein
MDIVLSSYITGLVTLFIIIDPVLVAPLFAALTHGEEKKSQAKTAIQAVLIAGGVLIAFALFGAVLLEHMGIELASFRAAGGLLLFLIGFRMFFEPDQETEAKRPGPKASSRENVAFFPLALPMLAGPGAIATVMLLMNQAQGEALLPTRIGTLAALATVLLISVPILMSSGRIAGALGRTGMNMVTRLLGMLLMALATQYVFDGVREGILERVVLSGVNGG